MHSESVHGSWYFPTISHEDGMALTTHPHLGPRLRKNKTIHLLPLWAFNACSRVSYTSVNMPVTRDLTHLHFCDNKHQPGENKYSTKIKQNKTNLEKQNSSMFSIQHVMFHSLFVHLAVLSYTTF